MMLRQDGKEIRKTLKAVGGHMCSARCSWGTGYNGAEWESSVWQYRFNKKKWKRQQLEIVNQLPEFIHRRHALSATSKAWSRHAMIEKSSKEKKTGEAVEKTQKEKENIIVGRATQCSTRIFSGPLSTKKIKQISKTFLMSWAWTKAILVGRIIEHFNKFPRLKDARFSSLRIERELKGRKRAAQDQDTTATERPAQHRHSSPPQAVHEDVLKLLNVPLLPQGLKSGPIAAPSDSDTES